MARPAKPKRVAALPLDKWARLDQIFLDVLARLGSSELAAGDLQRAFVDGRLKAATRCARTGECTLLPSAYWCEHTVHGWTAPRNSIAEPPVFVGASVWRAGNDNPIYGLVFFVLRSDFEKLYPPSEQKPIAQPRRKPGPEPRGDWPTLVGAWLVHLAKNNPSALDNVSALIQWLLHSWKSRSAGRRRTRRKSGG